MKLLNAYALITLFTILSLVPRQPLLRAQTPKQPEIKQTNPPSGEELPGFADTVWGMAFSDVREKFRKLTNAEDTNEKTEILNVIRNELILARRNDIIYRYSFYKTPYTVAKLADEELQAEEYDTEEGELFHVQMQMPFVAAALIKKKLEESYGKSNASIIDEKGTGADIWQLNGGAIFLWYENYEDRSFSRRVDYMSSELIAQIMKEYEDYFDAGEKFMLQKANVN